MIAGRMKHKLTLLEPIHEVDRFGADSMVYVERGTVWAERIKQTGFRHEEVGEHFPDYRAEFNIRDVHRIDENWRVRQLGGHLYTVTNIIPNIDRGFNTLICERVNE